MKDLLVIFYPQKTLQRSTVRRSPVRSLKKICNTISIHRGSERIFCPQSICRRYSNCRQPNIHREPLGGPLSGRHVTKLSCIANLPQISYGHGLLYVAVPIHRNLKEDFCPYIICWTPYVYRQFANGLLITAKVLVRPFCFSKCTICSV